MAGSRVTGCGLGSSAPGCTGLAELSRGPLRLPCCILNDPLGNLHRGLSLSMEVAMADRPTDSAKSNFRIAQDSYRRAGRGDAKDFQLFTEAGNIRLCEGLIDLGTGLRATYLLLEEVKGLLERQGLPR